MFTLPEQLTIAQIEQCRAELIKHIDDNEIITINSDDVQKIDTLGTQLILATIIYISTQNKELIWECKSHAIISSVKQLGLNEALLDQYINL